jgi:hypothetical protein
MYTGNDRGISGENIEAFGGAGVLFSAICLSASGRNSFGFRSAFLDVANTRICHGKIPQIQIAGTSSSTWNITLFKRRLCKAR